MKPEIKCNDNAFAERGENYWFIIYLHTPKEKFLLQFL